MAIDIDKIDIEIADLQQQLDHIILVQDDATIFNVGVEIPELQELLDWNTLALQDAQERRADLVVYTAPIHSLHKEILLEIFQMVVESEFHSPPELRPSGSPALLLSHIARRWRNVVINTPSFWTTFRVSFASSLDLISTHLLRSKDLPLHIALIDETLEIGFSATQALLTPVVSLLTSKSQYWERLQIFTSWISWHWLFDHLRDISCPRLRSLVLFNNSDNMLAAGPLFLSELPLLSSVYVAGLTVTILPSCSVLRSLRIGIKLGWEMLRQAVQDLVARSPSLESLALSRETQTPVAMPLGPLVFPSLKQLSLCCFTFGEIYGRDMDIITPSLETLIVAETKFGKSADLERILHHRGTGVMTYPQLRSFSLIRVELGGAITNTTLSALSSLEHLLLDINHVDSVLNSLKEHAQTPETDILLPHLQTLELVSGAFTDDCLSAMTAARLAVGHPIIVKIHPIDAMHSLINDTFRVVSE